MNEHFNTLASYIPLYYEIMLPWLPRLAIALGIFLLFFLPRKYFTRWIISLLLKLFNKTRTEPDNYIVLAIGQPLRLFFVITGIYLALVYLPLSVGADILISRVYRSALVILVSLGLWNLVGNYGIFADEMASRANIKVDKILIPFLSRTLKFIIAALALCMILQEWEYDINGFIAGLGLGGLAIALAAQQTLANVLGGIVLITDKPFSIGDWVQTPSVEGVVEDINFRSTKIRTFAQALVTVPNATLANEAITNWTRMGKRQIKFTLGVTYSTPREKLEKCVADIRNMLVNHPGIHPETIIVRFDSFGDSSLNILVYCYTHATKWEEFLQVKEDVNLKIMSILENEGVSAAFPSTSLYFENELTVKR